MLTEKERIELIDLMTTAIDLYGCKKQPGFFQAHFKQHYNFVMERIRDLSRKGVLDENTEPAKEDIGVPKYVN